MKRSTVLLDETMAASCIAQIGEEGVSETEALASFIAMNAKQKRTWAQAPPNQAGSTYSSAQRAEGPRQPRQPPRQSSTSTDDGTPKNLCGGLRKENRCVRCKKKGNWKAGCPDKQRRKDGTALAAFSGLTFLHTVEEESDWNVAIWRGQSDEDTAWQQDLWEFPRTLDCGQCSRSSLNWRSCMCQVGAKVERCWSPWRAGLLQDDDPERGRRCSTFHKINDDAHHDR